MALLVAQIISLAIQFAPCYRSAEMINANMSSTKKMTAGKLLKSVLLVSGMLILTSCTTSGESGILGSVKNPFKPTPRDADPVQQNPNATTRSANTTNSLSDYCPVTIIRDGTDTYQDFRRKSDRGNADKIRFQASITHTARECQYQGDQLLIKVGAAGRLINGPSGATGDFIMPIRVAVSEGGETIYSKLHKTKASIPTGSSNSQFSFVDDKVVIPAPRRKNVRIYIGFDEGPYNTP